MPTYLLLRNNKESGPYSQEQLIQLGLKPYDLVWMEGRSAAWRYPSEMPELKEYAPVVEEQPYDRFYKKQTSEQKEEPATIQTASTFERTKEVEIKEKKYEAYIPTTEIKEKEYKAFVPETETAIEEEKYEQYMPKKAVTVIMPKQTLKIKKEEPVYIPVTSPATVHAKPIEVETKYSESLDEIKDRYVKQLQQRKHNTAQKKFIIQNLKKAAIFIVIIGAGVLIGFAIKPKHASKIIPANSQVQNTSPANIQTSSQQEIVQPDNNSTGTVINENAQQPVDNKNEISKIESKPSSISSNTENKIAEEKKNVSEEKNQPSVNQSVINTTNGDRNKNIRNNSAIETNEKSSAITEDLSKFVSVKNNDYKIGTFGGVHNLQLTVTNDSKFALDNVIVELQYLKLSEQPIKVEHVKFQSIEPGGSLTIRVPDNNRGAKLSYKVIKIEPKESNANTAGL